MKTKIYVTVSLLALCLPSLLHAQSAGQEVFNTICASCHVQLAEQDEKMPNLEALRSLNANAILRALTDGSMRLQGNSLSTEQKVAVSEFLSGGEVIEQPVTFAKGMCESLPPIEQPRPNQVWSGWSNDEGNTRYATETGGITAEQVPRLKLKWAFGIPNVVQVRSQPSVWGDRLFVGSLDGVVFSLNAKTGCTYWSFKTQAGVRSATSVASVPVDGQMRTVVFFNDLQANAYALNAETGKLIWSRKVDDNPLAMGTGALKYYDGKVFVPTAGLSEEALANHNNDYRCCSFRGSVSALNASTGEKIWKTYTIPKAEFVRKLKNGKELWGPAGVAVWSTPTVDSQRNLLYFGTGNAYVEPPVESSNAVMAVDIDSGAVRWVSQLLANDIWSGGCDPGLGGSANNPGCFDPVGPDFDISASPVLTTREGGKDILVITQKSGMGYGIDPDANGKVLWRYRWGVGAAPGAVYGTSSDGKLAYFAVADQRTEKPGGLHAVDIVTGKRAWFTPPTETLCKSGAGCGKSQSAAVTTIPGAVLSGSVDGGLRAYDTKTGKIIWTFDTNKKFETVNGVEANGGSIDGFSAIVVDGMLYLTAGNGGPFGTPGNALLAFGLE